MFSFLRIGVLFFGATFLFGIGSQNEAHAAEATVTGGSICRAAEIAAAHSVEQYSSRYIKALIRAALQEVSELPAGQRKMIDRSFAVTHPDPDPDSTAALQLALNSFRSLCSRPSVLFVGA